jgi:protocatechuate 3,4-dioxygenase beta subunit
VAAALLAGAFTITCWLILGQLRTRQLCRRAHSAPNFAQEELRALVAQNARLPRLLVNQLLSTAAALGLLRPTILLPASAFEAASESTPHAPREDSTPPSSATTLPLRALLAHEYAHIQHRDLWLLALGRILLIVLFPHPLYHLLRRRTRTDQELLADAAAAQHCGRHEYAETLVAWARHQPHPGSRMNWALGIWERPSQLSRRIAMLLNEGMRLRLICSRRSRLIVTAFALGLVATVSAFTLRPAPAAKADPPQANESSPDEITLSGTVVDEQGQPIADATVYLREQPRGWTSSTWHPIQSANLATTTTNERGEYRFDKIPIPRDEQDQPKVFPLDVVATAKGYAVAWQHLPVQRPRDPVQFKLVPEAVLNGTLLSGKGTPAADVWVRAFQFTALDQPARPPADDRRTGGDDEFPRQDNPQYLDLQWSEVPLKAKTDANGRFSLSGLPNDMRIALLVDDERFVRHEYYAATTDEPQPSLTYFHNEPVHTGTISIPLTPAHELTVQVIYEDTGKPAVGINVAHGITIFPPRYKTDNQGRFTVKQLPVGKYGVYVYAPGDSDYLGVREQVDIPLKPSEKVHVVKLPRGAIITGHVLNQKTDQAIPGVEITYINQAANPEFQRTFPHQLKTDADGKFHIAVPPGKGEIVLYGRVPGYRTWQRSGSLLDAPAEYHHPVTPTLEKPTSGIKFYLKPVPTYAGQTIDAAGKPVEAVIQSREDLGGGGYMPLNWKSDAKGNFKLDRLFTSHSEGKREPVVVYFTNRKLKLAAREVLAAPDPDANLLPLQVELRPTGKVEGTVLAPSGKPLAGATVYLRQIHGKYAEVSGAPVITDAEGHFIFDRLIDGDRYYIDVSADGCQKPAWQSRTDSQFQVTGGQTHTMPEIRMGDAAHPDPQNGAAPALTPPATKQQTKKKAGKAAASKKGETVTEKAPKVTIDGTCRDENRKPVANARVFLFRSDHQGSQYNRPHARTELVKSSAPGQPAGQPTSLTYGSSLGSPESQRQLQEVRTDEDGEFQFADIPADEAWLSRKATMLVVVQAAGFGTEFSQVAVNKHDDKQQTKYWADQANFNLQQAATLRGRVTNADGQPIVGATVVPGEFNDFAKPIPGIACAVTDADGRYEIKDLKPFDVEDYPPSVTQFGAFKMTSIAATVEHPDYASGIAEFSKIPATLDHVLKRPAKLTGAVSVDGSVNRTIKTTVKWSSADGRYDAVLVDDNGNFSIDRLEPGKYTIEATRTDRLRTTQEVSLKAGDNQLTLRLKNGGFIKGRVIDDATGEAPKFDRSMSINVVAFNSSLPKDANGMFQSFQGWVYEDGSFSMSVPLGKNHLVLMNPDWQFVDADRWLKKGLDIENENQVEVELRVKPRRGGWQAFQAEMATFAAEMNGEKAPPLAPPADTAEAEAIFGDGGDNAILKALMSWSDDLMPTKPMSEKALRLLLDQDSFCEVERKTIDGKEQITSVYFLEGSSNPDAEMVGHILWAEHSLLAQIDKFPHMEMLCLVGSPGRDDWLKPLRNNKSLKALMLYWPKDITAANMKHVATLPNLTVLGIMAHKIDSDTLDEIQHSPQLEGFQIAGKLSDKTVGSLQGHPKLKKLGLASMGATEITDEALRYVASLPNLEELDFQLEKSTPGFTDDGLKHFAAAKKLSYLNLKGSKKITDAGLVHFHKLSTLKKLILQDTSVTQAGIDDLKKHLPDLEVENRTEEFRKKQQQEAQKKLQAASGHSPEPAYYRPAGPPPYQLQTHRPAADSSPNSAPPPTQTAAQSAPATTEPVVKQAPDTPPPPVTIAGTCHDEDGEPVADAHVRLYRFSRAGQTASRPMMRIKMSGVGATGTEDQEQLIFGTRPGAPDSQRLIHETKTDKKGQFQFPELPADEKWESQQGEHCVVVQATHKGTEFRSPTVSKDPDGKKIVAPLDFELKPAQSLRGRITNAEGKPVVGAIVVGPHNQLAKPLPGIYCAVTDEDGKYEINDLPPFDIDDMPDYPTGFASVKYLSVAAAVEHPDYAVGVVEYTRLPAQVDCVLARPVNLSGQVSLDNSGKPAEKATVTVVTQGGLVTALETDADGKFAASKLAPGKYSITVNFPGWLTSIEQVELKAGDQRVNFRLKQGGLIKGRVVEDATGKVPDVTRGASSSIVANVIGADPNNSCQSWIDHKDGTFLLAVHPGQNMVMYPHPMWEIVDADRWIKPGVEVAQGQTVEIELRLKPRDTDWDTVFAEMHRAAAIAKGEPRPPAPAPRPERDADREWQRWFDALNNFSEDALPKHPMTDEAVMRMIGKKGDFPAQKETIDGQEQVTGISIHFGEDLHQLGKAIRLEQGLLSRIEKFPHLNVMWLIGGPIADDWLKPLRGHQRLEELNIIYAKTMTAAGVAHLTTLPNLKKFSIVGYHIDDKALHEVGQFPKLEEFTVGGVFTDAGIAHFAEHLQERATIKSLHIGALRDSKITDEALRHVSALAGLQEFMIYNSAEIGMISPSQFTDAGLKHLSALTKLHTLKIGGEKITDAGLVHLGELKNLKSLSLESTSVTPAGIADLKRRLPNAEVKLTKRGEEISDTAMKPANRR